MKAFPDFVDFAAVKAAYPLVRVGWGGTRRVCYKIARTGFCVKFYKPKELYAAEGVKPKVQRELDRRRFDIRQNVCSQEVEIYERYRATMPVGIVSKLPEVVERVYDAELGYGILESYYTNADGKAIIPYEFEIARQSPENREIIYAQARELLDELADHAAFFYEPGNFHSQILPDGSIETKLVDFEPTSKLFVKIDRFWPWWRRRLLRDRARQYLRHIRETYGVVGRKTAFQFACERAFRTTFVSFEPVGGGNSSENYLAVAEDGTRHLVKAARPVAVEKLLALDGTVRTPLVPRASFGGRSFAYGSRRVCATVWVSEARAIDPAKMSPGQVAALLAAYARLSAAMPPGRIHGDLHAGNVLYRGGEVVAFIDFEMMREGLPTEDLMRIFLHAMERTRFWRWRRQAALLRNFTQMVAKSPYSREAWLQALDRYETRKQARRKAKKGGLKAVAAIESALRSPLYRRLRAAIFRGQS